MHALSESERKTLDELKNVKPQTIWGIAISNVVKDLDPYKFRYLICELKSQAADAPHCMKEILGPAYESVINL